MDIERVATIAAGECVRQHVGIVELGYLLNAYNVVQRNRDETLDNLSIRSIGNMVEPQKNNLFRFRQTPVTFANNAMGLAPELIDNTIDKLLVAKEFLDPFDFVREFLIIHPFVDGNGRTAWILYNLLMGYMDNPVPLPDFGF